MLWAVDSWLQENDPELFNDLLPPASVKDLQDLTDYLGKKLPYSFCELYLCHNGQASAEKNLLPGWYFMPLAGGGQRGLIEQYSLFQDLDGNMSDGFVKFMRCNTLWVPFATDFNYNFLAIDLDPPKEGKLEQVICFGHTQDARKIADSLEEYLFNVAVQIGVPCSLLEKSSKKSWPKKKNIQPKPGEKRNLFPRSHYNYIWSPESEPALPANVVELKPGIYREFLAAKRQAQKCEENKKANSKPDWNSKPDKSSTDPV